MQLVRELKFCLNTTIYLVMEAIDVYRSTWDAHWSNSFINCEHIYTCDKDTSDSVKMTVIWHL